jgi:hypothetical protein
MFGFWEFWGERVNPGKVGRVEFGSAHEACCCRPLIWARLIFVIIGLPVLWGLAASLIPLPLWKSLAVVIGGTLAYVAVSYLVNPEPDFDNIGWLGGMVDDPTRYSDDLNRTLIWLQIVLGPGRFIAESVLDARQLFHVESDEEDAFPHSDLEELAESGPAYDDESFAKHL